jgi:hypothetical protein
VGCRKHEDDKDTDDVGLENVYSRKKRKMNAGERVAKVD